MMQQLKRKSPVEANTDAWVDHYGQKLYAFAFMRLQNSQQAENFVQKTFLEAFKRKRHDDGYPDEQVWLTGVLKDLILDHFRKYFRRHPFKDFEKNEDIINSFFDDKGHYQKPPPGQKLEIRDAVEEGIPGPVYFSCLQQLPEAVREAFYLREVEKMNVREISEIVNVSLEHLHAMLQRARLQMSHSLQPYLSEYV